MLLNNHFILASKLLVFVLMLLTAVEGIVPKPSFRSPKNIAFATLGGGSSHHIWVLELLEELHRRGHSVSFHSKVSKSCHQKKIKRANGIKQW
jgi:hypothetical protein